MKRITLICATLTAACAAVGFGGLAQAAITVFKPQLTLNGSYVHGKCNFRIGQSDPYVAINGPCVLERANQPIGSAPNPRNIPPPPREDILTLISTGLFMPGGPTLNTVYCQRFGANEAGLPIVFGHPTNSSLNLTKAGDKTCKNAEPQVKAYFQSICLGNFVWVFDEYSLIPGLHFSFRRITQPLVCAIVAVYGGPN